MNEGMNGKNKRISLDAEKNEVQAKTNIVKGTTDTEQVAQVD